MSCLLLKTSGNLQKEAFKASAHEEGIGGKILGFLEGGFSQSRSDCPFILHGDSREGGSSSSFDVKLDIWNFESQELHTDICMCRNSHNHYPTDEETGITLTKQGSHSEQQQGWEGYIVDEVVCKLLSQLKLYPKTSKFSPEKGEHQKVNSQENVLLSDGKPDATLTSSSEKVEYHKVNSQENDLLSDNMPAFGLNAKKSGLATAALVKGSRSASSLPLQAPESAVSNSGFHEGNAEVKSALRGSSGKSSLVPRQQMHVTWAPDVYDPPCTSASHTVSPHRRRQQHHHRSRGEPKSRQKGKGHTDLQKKSQKKSMRRLKHPGEIFSGDSSLFLQRGQETSALMLKRFIAPSLDILTPKGPRVSPFIPLQKACFLSPALSLNECELVTLDKIQGCQRTHVQRPKLLE